MNDSNACFLFPHEREALKNALLRDVLNELERASADLKRSREHSLNARMSQRILELFFTGTAHGELTSVDPAA